jgi:hypothetical protein
MIAAVLELMIHSLINTHSSRSTKPYVTFAESFARKINGMLDKSVKIPRV